MSDLDDRLKAIEIYRGPYDETEYPGEEVYEPLTDEEIAQIRQAFTDAGYINQPEIDAWQTDFKKRWNVMTGAEWYDRVSVELERIAQSHAEPVQNLNYSDFIDALKRAADIEDKEQA